MAGKAKRLNKAAKEYNVSISTIVDFLATKGFEIIHAGISVPKSTPKEHISS